jgi:drug/metabolite transporter superfamily protein YnfA
LVTTRLPKDIEGFRCDKHIRIFRYRDADVEGHFGRVLAAYGGVFIVGSLIWGVIFDGFHPDRYDIAGAILCLVGIAVIMYAPR